MTVSPKCRSFLPLTFISLYFTNHLYCYPFSKEKKTIWISLDSDTRRMSVISMKSLRPKNLSWPHLKNQGSWQTKNRYPQEKRWQFKTKHCACLLSYLETWAEEKLQTSDMVKVSPLLQSITCLTPTLEVPTYPLSDDSFECSWSYAMWISWEVFVKLYMKYFICWTAGVKSSKLWSSQLWTQFMRRTGIARSRVQTPLKSWIFQVSVYAIA